MRVMAVLVAAVLAWCPSVFAFQDLTGEVTAEQPCPAFVSFRKLTNPDAATLAPGRPYKVLGRNEAGGAWLQILLPGAQPQQRWISVGCGRLVTDQGTATPASGLRPFFDDVAAGVDDPAPPPPPLEAFDVAVLDACGPWGSRPRARDFRATLDRPELQAGMEQVYAGLGRSVRSGPVGLPRFKDELTAVWFDAAGFRHVFCGEPSYDELGGMHYRGRYLQLQQEGIAGLMTAGECRATEVDRPVYTVGVRYRLPRGDTFRTACPKGYPYDLGAQKLLTVATQAYKAMQARRTQGMCLARIDADGGPDYEAVVVIRNDAIRTFYPDITPACDGGARPASCACTG
ncbi:MAG: EndoU domain-containing protein [Geminicoccaceae bacterium]